MKEKYNKIQIEEILNNPYVSKCSPKHITYTKQCKEKSVKLWNNWNSSREIFRILWFPEYIINTEIPWKIVCRWNNLVKTRWKNAFWIMSKRWRKLGFKWKQKINTDKLNKDEKIQYLETEVAYLKELYKEKHWFYP